MAQLQTPTVEMIIRCETNTGQQFDLARLPIDFPLQVKGTTLTFDTREFSRNALAALELFAASMREELDRG